jgi:tetratricopeptide (TPR) repeat protein
VCATIWSTLALLATKALFLILLVCLVFGSFGGLVAHFINNEKNTIGSAERIDPQDRWFLYPSALQSAAIGTAGAVAFLFFIIAVGGLTNFETLTEQLRSIAVSVIAGFGARSLLPRMVGHLEHQVAQARNESSKAVAEAGRASHDAREAIDKAEATRKDAEQKLGQTERKLQTIEMNMKLLEAAHPNVPPNLWKNAIELAESAMRSGQAKLSIWINVARVQRWHVSYEVAIETLNNALVEIERGRLAGDKNHAAVYYNRACYYEQLFAQKQEPAHREQALKDIEEALRHSQDQATDINEMLNDKDLESLRETEDFKRIVGRKEA